MPEVMLFLLLSRGNARLHNRSCTASKVCEGSNAVELERLQVRCSAYNMTHFMLHAPGCLTALMH